MKAGANSIFTGDKLLTTGNRGDSADAALFAKLGVRPMTGDEPMRASPRHPGLEPGFSATHSRPTQGERGNWTPGQARGDGVSAAGGEPMRVAAE